MPSPDTLKRREFEIDATAITKGRWKWKHPIDAPNSPFHKGRPHGNQKQTRARKQLTNETR